MLLVLLLSLFTFGLATPFHKYPFVFLLDVGNEELGTANTEQIKVSVSGGVLALKYPAETDGPIIGHVRVTGIDFGTDLKASIVEGGPGYRYVVLVLMGAAGKQYDTVITVQTLNEDKRLSKSMSNGYKVQEDTNDSAEEVDKGSINSRFDEKMSAEITKSESLTYEQNEDDLDEANNDDIDQLSSYKNVYSRNKETRESDSDIIQSDTNYNMKYDSEIENNDEERNIAEIHDNPIEKKAFTNADRTYVSVLPLNVLAGYGRVPGFYGNIMTYPQSVITRDNGLIESDNENDYSVFNKDLNNNIDDYVSSVDY
ncbi:unnamed protein product [Pieris macdunnoughi]|uniref:Uncharacterized protein n=1 Tax=Pieris macdunnoughi TaxID=345717 RepID=A0A821PBI6_9NEOP|nr:unnamed protein product [Pieris macdunnoughi]